jgi:hypothetical protein
MNSYHFDQQSSKKKKGTIVAMIAGLKPMCYSYYWKLQTRNKVSEITLDMAANMGLIAKNVSQRNSSQIDSMCKISIRGFTRIQIKFRL